MSLKDRMMEKMTNKMSKEEKQEMMQNVMEQFLTSMTPEERREMMDTMMTKMMSGMMENMPFMTGKGDEGREGVPDEMFERMRSCCARMGFELRRSEPEPDAQIRS